MVSKDKIVRLLPSRPSSNFVNAFDLHNELNDNRLCKTVSRTMAHLLAHHFTNNADNCHGPKWQNAFGDFLALFARHDVIGLGCAKLPTLVMKKCDGVDFYIEECLDVPKLRTGWLKQVLAMAEADVKTIGDCLRKVPEMRLRRG